VSEAPARPDASAPALAPALVVALVLVLAVALTGGPGIAAAAAQPDAGSGTPPDDEATALALLGRAERAGQRLAWTATEYVAVRGVSGTSAGVVDVRHVSGQRAAAQGSLERLAAHYAVRSLGADRVSGRAADVVGVLRGDGTLAGRTWLDRTTALPLRRELYATDGRAVRSSVLVDLEVRPDLAAVGAVFGREQSFAAPIQSVGPAGPLAAVQTSVAEAMASAGFDAPSRLGDTLDLVDAALLPDGVLRLTYTDGLCSVSLFRQRGRLAAPLSGTRAHHLGGAVVHVADGLPPRLTWEGGGSVFTVVGEAPDDVLAAIVAGLPHGGPLAQPPSLGQRLWRGAGRLSAWLNPFS
jgi:MucB/RseB N-terminal domain